MLNNTDLSRLILLNVFSHAAATVGLAAKKPGLREPDRKTVTKKAAVKKKPATKEVKEEQAVKEEVVDMKPSTMKTVKEEEVIKRKGGESTVRPATERGVVLVQITRTLHAKHMFFRFILFRRCVFFPLRRRMHVALVHALLYHTPHTPL